MTTATITLSRVQKNIRQRIDAVDFSAVNWKKVCFFGFLLSLALLVFYAWQINSLTGATYLLNSYEKQIESLSKEKKSLEASFAENSFLGQALEKITLMNFQRVTSVRYVQMSDSSVARAK